MDVRVKTVIKLIEETFNEQLSERKLAAAVNLSPWRLGHLFKSDTGVAPMQYLKAFRMERARELLETTFLSVKQIMNLVGFNDASGFTRNFKKRYRLSPTAYRRLAKAKWLAKSTNNQQKPPI